MNKKEISILLVFALLFSVLILVNLRFLFTTIVSPIFIFALFFLGIILGVVFKKNIKSILLEQNYLYYFFTYLLAGNLMILSFFIINNAFTDINSKTKIYKIVNKQNISKLINGEFVALVNLRLTNHKNKTLLLNTGKENYINDLIYVETVELEGNLGFKVIKDIFLIRTSNPK